MDRDRDQRRDVGGGGGGGGGDGSGGGRARPPFRPAPVVSHGCVLPLGPSVTPVGEVNFSVYAPDALRVELLVFEGIERERPVLQLECARTGDISHIVLEGLAFPVVYAFRVTTKAGSFVVEDPRAPLSATSSVWGGRHLPRSGLLAPVPLRSLGRRPPRPDIKAADLVIYEMHVRGFTQHASSGVSGPARGTFRGVIERADYLAALGVNCVELLPIHCFDEGQSGFRDPTTGARLFQYWGYAPTTFFAPHTRYASSWEAAAAELREMVDVLHERGIEVVLDVVFNHTGPGCGMPHLAKSDYYTLDAAGGHTNYSGCGNTVNCNNAVTQELIVDSMRRFVTEFGVDGFRIDEAPILCRDTDGQLMRDPPLVRAISGDPVLRGCRLIAEAWDAAGAYLVARYPYRERWMDWNGQYRDCARRFLHGAPGSQRKMAGRVGGSKDLYGAWRGGRPSHGVNFITCHDGMTARDLFTYSRKHNERNGESNRDGIDQNESDNMGVEGDAPQLEALRVRQVKNALLLLLVSRGVPMIRMGDELYSTCHGNNNPWNQDNELNHLDWSRARSGADCGVLRFARMAIRIRCSLEILRRDGFVWDDDVAWWGPDASQPIDWAGEQAGGGGVFLAWSFKDLDAGVVVYVAFNASPAPRMVTLPGPPPEEDGAGRVVGAGVWLRVVDTAWDSPLDIVGDEDMFPLPEGTYEMQPFSAILLRAPLLPGTAAYAAAASAAATARDSRPSGSSSGPGAPSFAREGLASHAEADSSGGGGGAGSASSAVAGAASGSGAAASLSAEAAAEEVAEEDALATALLLSRLER